MTKLKRENGGSRQHEPESPKAPSFGSVLEKTVEDNYPEDSCTVTYDRRSRLQTYYYHQSREYTY